MPRRRSKALNEGQQFFFHEHKSNELVPTITGNSIRSEDDKFYVIAEVLEVLGCCVPPDRQVRQAGASDGQMSLDNRLPGPLQ